MKLRCIVHHEQAACLEVDVGSTRRGSAFARTVIRRVAPSETSAIGKPLADLVQMIVMRCDAVSTVFLYRLSPTLLNGLSRDCP